MTTTKELPMSARPGAGSTFSAGSAPPKGLMQCEDFLQFEVSGGRLTEGRGVDLWRTYTITSLKHSVHMGL